MTLVKVSLKRLLLAFALSVTTYSVQSAQKMAAATSQKHICFPLLIHREPESVAIPVDHSSLRGYLSLIF